MSYLNYLYFGIDRWQNRYKNEINELIKLGITKDDIDNKLTEQDLLEYQNMRYTNWRIIHANKLIALWNNDDYLLNMGFPSICLSCNKHILERCECMKTKFMDLMTYDDIVKFL